MTSGQWYITSRAAPGERRLGWVQCCSLPPFTYPALPCLHGFVTPAQAWHRHPGAFTRWLYEMRALASKYLKPGRLTLQPSENSGAHYKWCFPRHLIPWAGGRATGTRLAVLPSLSALFTSSNFYLKIHFLVGWPTQWGMRWRGRWEGGSGWGTLAHLWLIHVNVCQNHYNTVKELASN